MIRAGFDRDNFTGFHRLWDPTWDTADLFIVTMALNRFEFLLPYMRFNNYRNGPVR